MTTFISADFFNNLDSATPAVRLRQAYGEVTDFLHLGGDIQLGQDWSTYTNLYAVPGTLEFWGPNSIFGARNPLVRWTMPLGDGLKLKLAAEAANLRNFEVDNSYQIDTSDASVNVEDRPGWPDGVVALSWEREPYNLVGAFIVRNLRARTDNGNTASAFGWGATFRGRINMPEIVKHSYSFRCPTGKGLAASLTTFLRTVSTTWPITICSRSRHWAGLSAASTVEQEFYSWGHLRLAQAVQPGHSAGNSIQENAILESKSDVDTRPALVIYI